MSDKEYYKQIAAEAIDQLYGWDDLCVNDAIIVAFDVVGPPNFVTSYEAYSDAEYALVRSLIEERKLDKPPSMVYHTGMSKAQNAWDIPQQPQVQYSLTQQLSELRVAARRLGLYDAEEWLAHLDIEIGQADGSL
jgi:hypothetical protein